jgi:hypothetical protein
MQRVSGAFSHVPARKRVPRNGGLERRKGHEKAYVISATRQKKAEKEFLAALPKSNVEIATLPERITLAHMVDSRQTEPDEGRGPSSPGVCRVTPPEISCNELARWLAELERLSLARPATASMAEYLEAFVSEGVIETKTAALVAAAYHQLRYAGMVPAELEMREASDRLRAAITTFATRPDEERRLVSERIRQRLATAASGEQLQPATNDVESADFAPHFDSPHYSTGGGSSSQSADAADPDRATKQSKRRREIRISSVPLETATLVVVGLVVAGYILRGGTDQAVSSGGAEASGSKRAKVFAVDVWKNDDYWAANLRWRAESEAARKQERTARLGFELLISEMPKDAGALNALAWLYLTSDDLSLRDPQRGLDLALRAVAISRAPAILDTLAEARFQTGSPDEAVKLEKEALGLLPRFSGFQDPQFVATLRGQLAKFQNAAKSTSSQASAHAQ